MAAAQQKRQLAMYGFRTLYKSQLRSVGKYEFKVTDKNVLGEGGFGTVWLGTRSDTKENVAIKQVYSNEETATFITRELQLLKECKHENIVKLYEHKIEHIDQDDWVFFVMEYCRNGDLNKFMKENDVSMGLGLRFIKNVTCAVKYMHSNELVHRDIKPGNILVRDSMCCVLADLGLSRDFPESAIAATMTADAGTIAWMAPEVLVKRNDRTALYGRSADIFSLGLVILAIINHQRGHRLGAYTVNGKQLCYWMDKERTVIDLTEASDDDVTRAVKALVLQMIKFKPNERLTIGQVLERILPIINSLKLRVEKLSEKRLGFDAHLLVGMSKSGHVLLGEKLYPHNLHKFLLQANGYFSKQWTQPLPQHVSPWCRKYLCEDESILLQDRSSSTRHRYTATLQHVDEWSQEGRLVQCLPPSRAVYLVVKEEGWKLVVREEDGSSTTLSPSPGHEWSASLSVCETPAGLVVLDATDGLFARHYFLTTFPPGEQPVTTRHEGQAEWWWNAVCCWEDLLLVACCDPASVHIHSSSGDLLRTLSHQQLQLSDDDWIQAVGVSGQRLMAAVGRRPVVSSLFVYELSYDYKAAADEAPAEEGATAAAATASTADVL